MRPVAALEVGGTHVTGAVLDLDSGEYLRGPGRRHVDSHADSDEILATFVRAGRDLNADPGLHWGVAMPDPFDYRRGIGRFHDVGKYESLDGVDVRAPLAASLPEPASITFINDADAFTRGEAHRGAGRGRRRCVGLTLGTGIGSGWVVDGVPLSSGPGVPKDGRAHHLLVGGRPLEDVMSRRAIRGAYAAASGDADADVREIAERARTGEQAAIDVLRTALKALGEALGPCLRGFGADLVVVGGSMAGSWDLFEPWVRSGLGAQQPPIRLSADAERAGLIGAALSALRSAGEG
jgi:glucokinase